MTKIILKTSKFAKKLDQIVENLDAEAEEKLQKEENDAYVPDEYTKKLDQIVENLDAEAEKKLQKEENDAYVPEEN